MDKSWHGKESRWADRRRVNIPIQVSGSAMSAKGSIKNVRLSGALVKANVNLGLHALIQLSINVPSQSQRPAAITACISRKTKEGIGVEWCAFAPSSIKDLLRSHSIPRPAQVGDAQIELEIAAKYPRARSSSSPYRWYASSNTIIVTEPHASKPQRELAADLRGSLVGLATHDL
jgi:hypothetical protein